MTIEELKKLINTGEKIDVEFKKSRNDLNKDVYESVCSFNNRNGGHLILGIVDETKEICGVNPDRIFVNKVYPNLGLEFLDFDVIRRAAKMAISRVDNHAWMI